MCAGFTPSAEAAQHSGMLLACTEGITGQGEGFYPINTADHMEPPLLSTTLLDKGMSWEEIIRKRDLENQNPEIHI